MPRPLIHKRLENPTARSKLKRGRNPHMQSLVADKAALGYQRDEGATEGRWFLRRSLGAHQYQIVPLGLADDQKGIEADGKDILNFEQAKAKALTVLSRRSLRRKSRLSKQDANEAPTDHSPPKTVEEAFKRYLADLERRKKRIIETQRRAEVLIYPELGHIRLEELSRNDINDWLDDLVERPALLRSKRDSEKKNTKRKLDDDRPRRASANRVLTMLKGALNFAYGKEWVPSNKEWDRFAVKPFHDVEVSRNTYLEIDEAKRLVNTCEPDFRLLVQAALQTGARYSSLCSLRVEDFNPDLHTLHIRKSKSGKSYYVVLSPEGVEFFRRITVGRPKKEVMLRNEGRIQRALEKERERLKALGKDPSKASVRDEGEWRTAEQTRLMREACERATIGHWESIKKGKETVKRFVPKVSFHGLRHSWASLALMNGTPMMVVAQNLGHKDTTMLQHHYGHIDKIKQQAINEGAPRFGFEPDHKIAVLNSR